MSSLEMKTAAERVGRAEQALVDAEERRTVAAAKVAQLRERLDAVTARRAQIRAELEGGKLDDRAAGGLLGLADEDAADLRALIEHAVAEESAAAPTREQQDLVAAQAALKQAVAAATVEALRDYNRKCEQALLAGLGAAAPLLREAGRPVGLREIWVPTNDMTRACALNVLPQSSPAGLV